MADRSRLCDSLGNMNPQHFDYEERDGVAIIRLN
ncbi:MAG: hypothetical protein ACI87O_000869, partial [Planctomycetota bacterium]